MALFPCPTLEIDHGQIKEKVKNGQKGQFQRANVYNPDTVVLLLNTEQD